MEWTLVLQFSFFAHLPSQWGGEVLVEAVDLTKLQTFSKEGHYFWFSFETETMNVCYPKFFRKSYSIWGGEVLFHWISMPN